MPVGSLLQADAFRLPYENETFQLVVTSPPYFGLRNYLTAEWIGGDPECDHSSAKKPSRFDYPIKAGYHPIAPGVDAPKFRSVCPDCKATKKDNQIGVEETIDDYINHLTIVTAEIWRILRPDGSFFLNIGDSYNSNPDNGIRKKSLCLIPFRLAIALSNQGWIVRSDIVWYKKNPMPESVKDRPTKAHEYIFFLTKNERYYYDIDAIREPLAESTLPRTLRAVSAENKNWNSPDLKSTSRAMSKPRPRRKKWKTEHGGNGTGFDGHSGYFDAEGNLLVNPAGRNKRTVWEITQQPYGGNHFATFPLEIPETIIKAGTSERGECPDCGSPWERIVKIGERKTHPAERQSVLSGRGENADRSKHADPPIRIYTGWRPTCDHYDDRYRQLYPKSRNARKRRQRDITGDWWKRTRQREGSPGWKTVPQKVLDPFAGSGTSVLAAQNLGRIGIGSDLSFEYIRLARDRTGIQALNEWTNGISGETELNDLPLFEGLFDG